MSARKLETSGAVQRPRSVRIRLLLAAAALATAGTSCTSDSAPAPEGQNAAGAGGESGAGPDGVDQLSCTDLAPVDPAPDLTGRWALRTIASRYVPATGLTSAFYTRTVSILVADVTQTGTQVGLEAHYCEQHAEDPDAAAHVVIPESYARSLAPVQRTGTYAPREAGAAVLELPSFVEVVGATLADPATDALPADATEPTVNDQDQDGFPGVTIKLSGLVSGDLYVAQRQVSALTGVATGEDRVTGHYEFSSEQNVLDSNPSYLKALAAQTAIPDPERCASTFTMVRIESTAACEDALGDPALFD